MNKNENISYVYKPSYIYKSGERYKYLTEKYEYVFKDFLDKKEYDKLIFFEGLEEYKKYIESSFYFGVNQNYDSKTPQEKIVYAIFFRYSKVIGSQSQFINEIKQDISDLSENAMLYSLGIDKYKKRNFLWDREIPLLKHTVKKVFFVLLQDFFKKKELELNYENEINSIFTKKDIENELNSKRIPRNVKETIQKYLYGEIDYSSLTENDLKYIGDIYDSLYNR